MHNQFETSQQSIDKEMIIRLGALTDVGQLREHNEDNFLVCPNLTEQNWFLVETPIVLNKAGSLLAVADGMGGENAGEVASAIAMEAIKDFFSARTVRDIEAGQAGGLLLKAILFAHKKVVEHSRNHPECEGMGTTILLAWVINREVYIAWSGDSRCYLYRNGQGLKVLSNDHSVVWELVMNGKLDIDEAESHPESHIITQSLGDNRHPPRPDILVVSLQAGDKLLLCSDGLNGMLTSRAIEQIIRRSRPLGDLCKELIDAANRNGGEDNITVVMMEVLSEPASEANFLSGEAETEDAVSSPGRWFGTDGKVTARTYPTARQKLGMLTIHPKTYLWIIGIALVLVLAVVILVNRQAARPVMSGTNGSGMAQGPERSSAPLKKSNITLNPTDPLASGNKLSTGAAYTLPTDTARRLVSEIRTILKRYDAIKDQIDFMNANPGPAPIPNNADLDASITALPGYGEIKNLASDVAVERALHVKVKSAAQFHTLQISLRKLGKDLTALEKKLGKTTVGSQVK